MNNTLQIISVDENTVETEGICCAFSDKKHREGVQLKEDWLKARFTEGLKFKKLNIRGKVFIEYIPAEYAWSPIEAPDYMFIHCFWVSGRYKGQGWGKQLLEECFQDAQGKKGIVVISTKKKMPFTVEKKFYLKYGFEPCDSAPPYFELLVKRFNDDTPLPTFRENAKLAECKNKEGLTFMYTDQCPYLNFWVDQMIGFAARHDLPTQKIRITTRKEAQNTPSAFPMYSLFYQGKFVTHEMMAEKKFEKLLSQLTG